MKKTCLFIGIFSLIQNIDLSAQETPDLKAVWPTQAIVVDGSDKDWRDSSAFVDTRTGIKYFAANNDSMLYICVKTKDELSKTKMLAGGFTVSVNREGKKKQSASIQFPMKNEDQNSAAGGNLKAMQAVGLVNAKQFELDNFANGNGTYLINETNPAGIAVMIGFNNAEELVYEAAVPFNAFYRKQMLSPDDAGKIIAISFSTIALPKPSTQAADAFSNPGGRGRTPTTNRNDQPVFGKMDRLYQGDRTWLFVALAGK